MIHESASKVLCNHCISQETKSSDHHCSGVTRVVGTPPASPSGLVTRCVAVQVQVESGAGEFAWCTWCRTDATNMGVVQIFHVSGEGGGQRVQWQGRPRPALGGRVRGLSIWRPDGKVQKLKICWYASVEIEKCLNFQRRQRSIEIHCEYAVLIEEVRSDISNPSHPSPTFSF